MAESWSYPQSPAPLRRAWTAMLPILAEPEPMDKQLAGTYQRSRPREHGATRRDDIARPGPCTGVPAKAGSGGGTPRRWSRGRDRSRG